MVIRNDRLHRGGGCYSCHPYGAKLQSAIFNRQFWNCCGVQGTVTFRSSCAADALASVAVNGNTKYYPSKIKIGPNGGAITIFVNYTAPLTFTNSSASINLQAIVANGCSTQGDWEFQGIMQFQ
jgi:hypothetical protein